jgi:hypothetical protein
MQVSAAAPLTVRAAGIIVVLQGLTGVGFAIAVLVRALGGNSTPGNNLYGEAGYFAVLGALVAVAGTGLILGKRWGRTPAIVIELLLLGVAYYAGGPSGRPEFGIPVALVGVLVLVLLFVAPSRAWFLGEPATPPPDDQERRR